MTALALAAAVTMLFIGLLHLAARKKNILRARRPALATSVAERKARLVVDATPTPDTVALGTKGGRQCLTLRSGRWGNGFWGLGK